VLNCGVIPPFDTNGLLPPGIHWATINEVIQRFGANAHRLGQLAGLQSAIVALAAAGCTALFLDGSFVTDKEFPEDYDVCWNAVGVVAALLDPVMLNFDNQRAAQKLKYGGEFFPADWPPGSNSPFQTFLEFFQSDENTGASKGIVGIRLKP
jgi:hypothetical protein